ncbi:SGNH/GDSL hydrolase family protein [Streptomyces sp. NPDC001739]|uniref:SGNH/GDSL hydrolase family protein n=1 Tax=Streptomyces sp. NPDC001633 TaxID=3364595 RepID=UPI0036A9A1E2
MTQIDRPFRLRRHGRRAHRTRTVTAVSAVSAVSTLLLALASCSAGDSARPHSSPSAGRQAKQAPAWRTHPGSIAALGDSITVGFNACTILSECPAVSWSTGTDPKVDSLARRLVKRPATHSWNFARAGALMNDLPGQVAAAAVRKPELVTVLIGANDACRPNVGAMTPTASFRADFTRSLKALRRSLPHTQVYVASVPDLLRLWSEGRKNPLGKEVWKLGICGSMLRDPDDLTKPAQDRREKVRERVMAYNSALAEVCGKDPLCRFDPAVFDYRFTGRQLSTWDWFHPGAGGQKELAELAFRTITRRQG